MAAPDRRVAAVVLAAGRSTRFGSPKLVAELEGRPLIRHVLATAIDAGLDPIVIVTGPDGVLSGIDLEPARVVVNPRPEDGLSSSVRLGLAAIDPERGVDSAVILLGDQPRVRTSTIRTLVDASTADQPLTVPAYSDDGAPNPLVARRAAWRLADDLVGDRGFGQILGRHPELVRRVPIRGANPDVDRPRDLEALERAGRGSEALEAAWADRVRANRAQVDRVREVPDGADFYRPVRGLFVADPGRIDDPVLDALLELARPDDTWLDVGAGAGRYALPLAARVAEVIALDASPGMLDSLRAATDEHRVANIRPLLGRWPPAEGAGAEGGEAAGLEADVVLVAHVGYDVEAIGPFLRALERAARRLVVAVLMERTPASLAGPFWPVVHGEARVELPALPELVALLEAQGRGPAVRVVARPERHFASRDDVLGFVRRQTWVQPGSDRDTRLQAALDRWLVRHEDGSVSLPDVRGDVGIVTWAPPGGV